MVIALDGMPLAQPKTGVGHYTFELARALAQAEPSIEIEFVSPSTFPPQQNSTPLTANLKSTVVPVGIATRHWWSLGLPLYLKGSKLELFHGTNYDIPLWGGRPTVLTVHDLSLLVHPETHRPRAVRRARRRLPLMTRRADAVIVPTQAVKQEVVQTLAVSDSKIFVVPESARDCFGPLPFAETEAVRRSFNIHEDFLLAVGTIEPRKNYETLISAFADVVTSCPDVNPQLVIVGGRGWLSDGFFELLEKSPAREQVVLTGYLGDGDLRALYSSCRALVYPSIHEGFGLPPLEAMSCGAPVIASNVAALAEVTDGTARLVDPKNKQEMAQAMIDVLRNDGLRNALVAGGKRRAAQFSWSQTAALTLEVYRVAAKIKRSRGQT